MGVVVLVWFWNMDDCGMFPKMGYYFSAEDNVVDICVVSDGQWP